MPKPSIPKPSPAPSAYPGGRRPLTWLTVVCFALFSIAGFYFMRIENSINGVPVDFEKVVTSGQWADGTPIKQTYTGVEAIDFVFRWLVPAFIAGPAGYDQGVRLQQIHFLVNFFAVVAIWNVEASRQRNRGSALSYTALWAVFYQTVAGAAIIPLYYLVYAVISRNDSYLSKGREVSRGQARALLPALVIGYLVPTTALYIPWGDSDITQNLTALWQISPAIPNLLLLVFSPFQASERIPSNVPADVKYLKRIYLAIGIISTLTQLATFYISFTSDNPQLTLSYIFLPNKATWKESTVLGLHYIFQWDFWIIYVSSLVWCYIVVVDAVRYVNGRFTLIEAILSIFNLTLVSFIAGPGTTMALVWNWRENWQLKIEQNHEKPKSK
ncbi:hypothetical protein PFICI_12437 [Pestalotiopsis fici W106-1]|uniref:Uncharacterized protein n=1 Tax=Pestalotiopsis fici (strain W106-1 / CGMCC3.15140) TaxID=1229662 RepID=W3WNQ5_PESFW|nr:uncharacterized protein PFICI_12437 [Pestalotiopsis fici W106-1]ETS75493.1 hypothetical protein PFICI_12437 [Pestalotiopsis fici W106-1]